MLQKGSKKHRKVKYLNSMRAARKRMWGFLKKIGRPGFRNNQKQWLTIIEFAELIGKPIENPTRKTCLEWLYDEYEKGELEPFIKNAEFFYSSSEWRLLRKKVLNHYGEVCMKCSSTEYISVDHIKPRSIYPELELQFENMQVLCRSCNSSKSNTKIYDLRNQPT